LLSPECTQVNTSVRHKIEVGQLSAAQADLQTALRGGADERCQAIVNSNLAAIASLSGQRGEAEQYALRSLAILRRFWPPADTVHLRPLQILAGIWLDDGLIGKARGAWEKMKLVNIQSPAEAALVHGIGATILQAEGRFREAELEYNSAIHTQSGAGAERAAMRLALAQLYLSMNRTADAGNELNQADTILSQAKDAVPLDWIKLRHVRALYSFRAGNPEAAETDLREALASARNQPLLSPLVIAGLLTDYAKILRKTHKSKQASAAEKQAFALKQGSRSDWVVDMGEWKRPERVKGK